MKIRLEAYAVKTACNLGAATLLLAAANVALAQTDFQLPRECLERIVVNPERCVIQDGPPRLPLARQPKVGTGATGNTAQPQANVAPAAERTQSPSSVPAVARR